MSFNQFGFFKEYYVDSKFISSKVCEKDREEIGYTGRRVETLLEDIIFKNKKKIKAGKVVTTIIYPLCGGQIK